MTRQDEWFNYLVFGGDMPDITKDWVLVDMPIVTTKIPVTHIESEYTVDVVVDHECDWRDYPEVCQDCFEHHLEGAAQMAEDRYRDTTE